MNEKTDPRALRGQIVYSESSNKLKIEISPVLRDLITVIFCY
ncbi:MULTISPECIES: hypothetical protein [Clostridia]|nr:MULTISPECIES: hypothetical protein [Clostridia]